MKFVTEASSFTFHGATEGRKVTLLEKHPRICVEADLCHGFVENGNGGITCDYESIIGYGNVDRYAEKKLKKVSDC